MVVIVAEQCSIGSTSSSIKLRTRVTRGAGRTGDGLQARESAQERWRAITGAHLVALVRAGAVFKNGEPVERSQDHAV
ncbi:hypothetical protein ACIP3U_34170 [[Kitasatospora] papulosa]|uniref:hypothetical protein n=1 Tax=[Kitasatospora] papulosa TaxID=1464011 RepID=UPI00382C6A6B